MIRRGPPQADLQLLGAWEAKLVVVGILVFTLTHPANPRAGLGTLPKKTI